MSGMINSETRGLRVIMTFPQRHPIAFLMIHLGDTFCKTPALVVNIFEYKQVTRLKSFKQYNLFIFFNTS